MVGLKNIPSINMIHHYLVTESHPEIEKLKKAEAKGTVDPFETDLENWEKELELMDGINAKVTELLSAISKFDL